MGKLKLLVADVKDGKDLNGKKIYDVIATRPVPNEKCKECHERPRENGTSRCVECAAVGRRTKFMDTRLLEKVEKQITN